MAGLPNPVLHYHPDGYVVARKDLKGRHSAGESFLSAFLEQIDGPEVHALCDTAGAFQQFAGWVANSGRPLTPKHITRNDAAALRAKALLNLPYPGLAREARLRSFLGDQTYALCGVTHTISSREVLDSIADLAVAPVMRWDALICTSRAVHAALSTVLELVEADLRDRIGAARFTRPMMPILPLGIHARRFTRKEEDRKKWRDKLGIAEGRTAVLFFGRLSFHAKASPFQLAQAIELAATRSKRDYAVIWCGWFSDDFQQRVFMETAKKMAPSVDFHHVDGRDENARFSIWSAADIFCSLSDNIQESFGLTVIEAMAAGLPVVVTNWNGYREAVHHVQNGVLINSYAPQTSFADAAYRHMSGIDTYDVFIGGLSQFCMVDIEEVARWFNRLASDSELRKKLGAAARRTVEEQFDWKVVLPRYGELWREQIAQVERARAAEPVKSSATWKIQDPSLIFAGFPSDRLADEMLLARGPLFDQWEEIAKQSGIVINGALLMGQKDFHALRENFRKEEPRLVRELLDAAPQEKRGNIFRTLHWLVKVGLLRLASGSGLTSSSAR